ACLAQPIPLLASGVAALAWLPSAWIARTAETFAQLPSARLGWWEGAAGFALLALLGAVVAVAIAGIPHAPHGRSPPGRVRTLTHRLCVAAVALTVGVAAGTVTLGGVAAPLTAPDDWSIAL